MSTAPPESRSDNALVDHDRCRAAALGMIEIGQECHRHGWSRATSSNYSVRVSDDPLRLLVTASGKHKDRLTEHDFVMLDGEGVAVEANAPRSSAETMLHVVLMNKTDCGAVLHTHSVWGTLLTERYAVEGAVTIAGYEMLKALPGVTTHDTSVRLPIFPNTQDIDALSQELAGRLEDEENPMPPAFLIHKHGLYTWAGSLDATRASLEALEFLFECEERRLATHGCND